MNAIMQVVAPPRVRRLCRGWVLRVTGCASAPQAKTSRRARLASRQKIQKEAVV